MASWDFIQKQILLGEASTGKSSLLVRLTDDRFLTNSEPTIGVEFGSRLVTLTEGKDEGKKVKLQIWDTAGQESFRSITRSYYRGAGGALLIFDITSRPSFIACRSWLADLRAWGEEDLVILLVGNKGDLCAPLEGNEARLARGEVEEAEEEAEAAPTPAAAEGGDDDEEEGEQDEEADTTLTSLPTTTTTSSDPSRAILPSEALSWAREEGLAGYVETSAKSGSGVEAAFDKLTREVHRRHQAGLAARRGAGNAGGSGAFSLGGAAGRSGKCC
ncbi:small GTPase superfamily [Leucosporidium creatinivorum]|uniref:Small GTPase superfamily n=1 Tax=Leucosporidium creatinivorum TaxID=106004 RepID=A0A1Y2FZ69_9BASI|nr:small GTPase superfamily [Leucosporidium creatinivorum]